MAVDYSVPPWLHGANPLQAVEAGASLGSRIAESNQRSALEFFSLQAQQQRFAQQAAFQQQQLEAEQAAQQQRFAAQQQVNEQNQLREDQKLQIETAYKNAQIGLAKQKLDLTTQAASQKFQAQQQFLLQRDTIKSGLINEEGMDPAEAEKQATIQALFINGPSMGMSPASLGALARSTESKQGEWKTSPGGANYYQTPGGPIHFEPKVPQPRFDERQQMIKDLNKEVQDTSKELRTAESDKNKKPEDIIPIKERLYNAQAKRHKLFQKQGQTQTAPATSPESVTSQPVQPAPLPKDEKELETGTLYSTSRGPAVWDGKMFMPASQAPQSPEHPSDEE